MKWFTRENAKTDRVACPWLISKFIDPDARFVYLPKDEVLETARKDGGKSFDCPGADYTHEGDCCSFETLMQSFDLWGKHPGLDELARIVHTADVATQPEDPKFRPEGAGLRALGTGFAATGIAK